MKAGFPKKGKKVMKKLSPKQKKLASLSKPKNKITGADLKNLERKVMVVKKYQTPAVV